MRSHLACLSWVRGICWAAGLEEAPLAAARALEFARRTRSERTKRRRCDSLATSTRTAIPRSRDGRGALSTRRSPGHRTRHAPPRRPLPPRPRQALPPHGQARAGPGAPRHRDDDVPRDGHDVLAGEGGGGDDIAGRIDRPQAWTSYLTRACPRAIVAETGAAPGAWGVRMRCPRCQQENETVAKFCAECATPLAWCACAKYGRQLSTSAKFCPPGVPIRVVPQLVMEAFLRGAATRRRSP